MFPAAHCKYSMFEESDNRPLFIFLYHFQHRKEAFSDRHKQCTSQRLVKIVKDSWLGAWWHMRINSLKDLQNLPKTLCCRQKNIIELLLTNLLTYAEEEAFGDKEEGFNGYKEETITLTFSYYN